MFEVTAFTLLFLLVTVVTAIPPLSLYRTTEQLIDNISSLTITHPDFTHQGCQQDPNIKYLTLGHPSPNPLPVAIITCNVHAHELITGQICVDLANYLQNHSLLHSIRIIILYMANHNRNSVMAGGFCLRTDQNGIDPNRNFPVAFTLTQGETYGGSDPLSEGYSRCLAGLAQKLHPLVYLDIHSGEFSLVYYQQQGDTILDASQILLERLKEKFCRNCRVVNAETLKVGGQAFEFMKYSQDVRYSSLLQVYGGYKAGLPQDELCFTIFNPFSERQLMYFREKWVDAIVSYLEMALEAQAEREKEVV